jgi:hypothetical protein
MVSFLKMAQAAGRIGSVALKGCLPTSLFRDFFALSLRINILSHFIALPPKNILFCFLCFLSPAL